MLPIAAAPNIRAQVFAVLEADVVLVDPYSLRNYLPNGVNSILPRPHIDPGTAKGPFLFMRFEGEGSTGLDNLDRLVVAIEVHDWPGYGLWKIDRIVDRVLWLFNHRRWLWPTASMEKPRRSWRAGATGELPDPGWNTLKRVARFQLYKS